MKNNPNHPSATGHNVRILMLTKGTQSSQKKESVGSIEKCIKEPKLYFSMFDYNSQIKCSKKKHLTSKFPLFFWIARTLLNKISNFPSTSPQAKLQRREKCERGLRGQICRTWQLICQGFIIKNNFKVLSLVTGKMLLFSEAEVKRRNIGFRVPRPRALASRKWVLSIWKFQSSAKRII